MKKRITGILVLHLILTALNAQSESKIDSLLNRIQSCDSDSLRNDLYLSLASEYCKSDTAKMNYYLEQMVQASSEKNYESTIALAFSFKGRICVAKGDGNLALGYYDQALSAYRQAGDMIGYYENYVNKGNIFLGRGDFGMALAIYQESLNYYKKINYVKGINRCLNNLGIVYKNYGEYDKAIEYLNETLLYEPASEDSISIAKTYLNLGNIHVLIGSYENATQLYNNALQIFEKNGMVLETAMCLGNIGVIQNKCGQYQNAFEYFNRALELNKISRDKRQESITLVNIGTNFSEMGAYTKALDFLEQGQLLKEELGDKKGISNCYLFRGEILTKMKRYAEAESLTLQALDIKKEIYDREGTTSALLLLGELYLYTERMPEARSLLENGLDTALELGSLENIAQAYDLLRKLSFETGDFKEAYNFMEQYKLYNDSLQNSRHSEIISEMVFRYHAKFLESENENLKFQEKIHRERIHDQQILIIAGIISLLLLFTLLSFVVYYNQRKRQTNLQLEKKNLTITKQNVKLDKLNKTKDKLLSIIAHDLRNTIGNQVGALNMLAKTNHSASETDRERMIANLSHSASASLELLENLLAWTKMQEGELEFHPQETDISQLVLKNIDLLEQTAKSKSIFFNYQKNGPLNCYVDEQMIASVLRNLMINAIKFSFRDSVIDVKTLVQNFQLVIEIEDHGMGLSKEAISRIQKGNGGWSRKGTENERGSGLGLSMVNEFVKIHNGSMEIESKEHKGSLFRILIPCKK